MSDYSRQKDFSIKDGLSPGDPNKIIYGADVDAEFDAVLTAVNSKADKNANPTMFSTTSASFTDPASGESLTTLDLGTVTSGEIYLINISGQFTYTSSSQRVGFTVNKDSGTATIAQTAAYPSFSFSQFLSASLATLNFCETGLIYVTGSGTLVLDVEALLTMTVTGVVKAHGLRLTSTSNV